MIASYYNYFKTYVASKEGNLNRSSPYFLSKPRQILPYPSTWDGGQKLKKVSASRSTKSMTFSFFIMSLLKRH